MIMSWGMRDKLSCQRLDPVQIEAAARAVTASIPGLELEISSGKDWATCYFTMGVTEARKLDSTLGSDFDKRLAEVGEEPQEKITIQIDFWHHAADPDLDQEAYCEFEYDTGRSAIGCAAMA